MKVKAYAGTAGTIFVAITLIHLWRGAGRDAAPSLPAGASEIW